MRALITGATGLVGSHIVDRLLADGWSVRALVRSTAPDLEARGVEVIRGDVLDADSFARAAAKQDIVFHTAAVIEASNWESFRRTNLEGTQNAIAAARKSGARLLQVSSVAVYSSRYKPGSGKIREDTDLGAPRPESLYARSKRESEDLVFAAHAAGRIWATAIRPDVIYGPRDRLVVPKTARLLRTGFAPLIGGGHSIMPIVHATNVADGAVLAATHDAAGGRAFNLANDFDVTVREFFTLAAEGLGRRVHMVPIPRVVAGAAFSVAFAGLRLFAGDFASVVSPDSLSMLSQDNPYDSGRARRELGWAPRVEPRVGIPESFRWWRENTKGAT